jgi:hypothetical protein
MLHAEHSALINDLVKKVEAGPATPGFPGPHFQSCWALIKRIGPSFREVRYPNSKVRDASWGRFQTTVSTLKLQQSAWEDGSKKLLASLLERIEAATPALSMAELCGPATGTGEPPVAEPAPDPEAPANEAPLSPAARRKARLQHCDNECKEILALFMKSKGSLTPLNYKTLSDAIRGLRQAVQAEWETFKDEARAHGERLAVRAAEKAEKAAKPRKAPVKRPPARKQLDALLREEQIRLDHLRGELPKLEAVVASSQDEARVARTQVWIRESREQIAELEASVGKLKTQIEALG